MRLQTIIITLLAALLFAGCTTFSLSNSETVVQKNDTSPSARFVREARTFQNQFSKAGWLREEEQQSRARAFLSILNKGWSRSRGDDGKTAEQRKDAVALYLARQNVRVGNDDPAALALRIQNDLDEALHAMTGLNDLATPLLTASFNIQPKVLRNDVMVLERALLSARKAQSLFEGAVMRTNASLEPSAQNDLSVRLQANTQEIGRMKVLADTLNSMRLKTRPVG